jgi:hypothetical protein
MIHINDFNGFLNEGVNDNFLYHSTAIRKMKMILESNTLKTSEHNVISFSRNKNFWFGYLTSNSIRIVLNKKLLSHNYKIDSFDFFNYKTVWDENSKSYNKVATKKWDSSRKKDYEYEERISENIENIGKYIHEIEFSDIALGLNKDYQALGSFDLPELKMVLNDYLVRYPHIKLSVAEIDNRYIKGGLIQIKRKYDYVN